MLNKLNNFQSLSFWMEKMLTEKATVANQNEL